MSQLEDRFGFLPNAEPYQIGEYLVSPIEGALERHRWWPSLCKERFIAPHEVCAQLADQRDVNDSGLHWTGTLWKLAPTHMVRRSDGRPLPDDFRRNEGSFLIHLIAFWFEARAQFHDFWFDGRIPPTANAIAIATSEQRQALLEAGLATWRAADAVQQRRLRNALYMHGRSLQSELEWERFLLTYTVSDSLWKIVESRPGRAPRSGGLPHKERLVDLAQYLGLFQDPVSFQRFVTLRNEVIHEAGWAQGQPGSTGSVEDFLAAFELHRFNQRAIVALFQPHVEFVRSTWRAMGNFMFDP